MSSWETKTLAEICDSITVGHVGPMASQYVPDGVPFLRSQNVRPGRLDLDGLKFIPPDFHHELRKSRLRTNDIVIVRTGQPGAAALIPAHFEELNCADLVIVRPSVSVDPRFVCYSINATSGQYVSAHLVGAVQQHFNVASARNLRVFTPPLSLQRSIAEVLTALEDKIAVNERVVLASHQLAQTYVAKAAEGASRVALSDLADITMGSSPPGDTYNEKQVGLPFYQGTRDFGFRFPSRRVWCTSPVRAARAGATLVSVRAPVGRLNVATEDCCIGRGLAGLASKPNTPSLLFHTLTAIADIWAPFESEGTVFGSINKKQLEGLAVPYLDPTAAHNLESVLARLDERVGRAFVESEALARLRDTLLPGLMSGKIRVREAERAVEQTT